MLVDADGVLAGHYLVGGRKALLLLTFLRGGRHCVGPRLGKATWSP